MGTNCCQNLHKMDQPQLVPVTAIPKKHTNLPTSLEGIDMTTDPIELSNKQLRANINQITCLIKYLEDKLSSLEQMKEVYWKMGGRGSGIVKDEAIVDEFERIGKNVYDMYFDAQHRYRQLKKEEESR